MNQRDLIFRALSVTGDPDVLNTAAALYYKLGDAEAAHQLYRQLLTLHPHNTQYALKYVSSPTSLKLCSNDISQPPRNTVHPGIACARFDLHESVPESLTSTIIKSTNKTKRCLDVSGGGVGEEESVPRCESRRGVDPGAEAV